MTGPRIGAPSTGAMTREAFVEWFRWFTSEQYQNYLRLHGKPRVRVPVERQTPNEADL